ncbi:MAG: cytochrome c [Phycisphaerales bacterium]|nr:MAG: cytochrome c [Phycisphaerales bacterium]
MPRPLVVITLIVIAAALLPPAIIAVMRTSRTATPRIHFVQDMDNQGKFRAQHENPRFPDGRAMRPAVEGTIAVGEPRTDSHYYFGRVGEEWAPAFPAQVRVNESLMERGRARFNIYCQPCHGLSGYGDGIVDQLARDLLVNSRLGKGTMWVRPRNLHEELIRSQTVGEIFNTITNGKANMQPYGAQIPVEDRWAIVAWVRALQRSQNAELADVPAELRDSLETINLAEEEASNG